MPVIVDELFEKLTLPWDRAGEALGLGPAAVRAAIRRREIPTTGIGKIPMVPTIFIRQRVGLEPAQQEGAAAPIKSA